jgi:hypothetical protein
LYWKLSREKLRKNEQIPFYAFYTLLYPNVQGLDVKTLIKEKSKFLQNFPRHSEKTPERPHFWMPAARHSEPMASQHAMASQQ